MISLTTTEKLIMVQQWSISNSDLILRSFTASWCPPCTRIKPHLLKLEEQGVVRLRTIDVIRKEDKRPGMLIPFFELIDKNDTVVRFIQTSKEEEFTRFLQDDQRTTGDMGGSETGAVV